MSQYSKWAQREHSEARRIAITLRAGPVFLGLLPFLVAAVGPRLDRRLGLPSLRIGRVNRVVGGLLMVLGFSLGFWSVITQLTRGRGTPLPVMPTQELLTERFGEAYLAYRREAPFTIPTPPERAAR